MTASSAGPVDENAMIQESARQPGSKTSAETGRAAPLSMAGNWVEGRPRVLSHEAIRQLQRTAGNAAVARLVAPKPSGVRPRLQPGPATPPSAPQSAAPKVGAASPSALVSRGTSFAPPKRSVAAEPANPVTETEAGRSTLAHERTHVSQGRTAPGLVQREPAPQTPIGPPAPNASAAAPDKKYNLTLSTGTFNDLTENQALMKLAEAYTSLEHAVDAGRGEHGILFGMRSDGFFNAIGSLLIEITGEKFPELGIWTEASTLLVRAQGDLIGRRPEAAATDLLDAKTAYDKASQEWEAYKNQLASAETKAFIAIGVAAVVIIAVAAIAVVLTPVAAVGGGVVAGAEGGGAVAAGGAVAGAEGGGAVAAGGAVAGAEGGVVAGATIPEIAVGVGETLPGAGAGVVSETGPLIFQELLAIYRAAGPVAMRAAARGMSVQTLEKLLTFITVKLIGAGPLTQRDVTIVDEIYEIILVVWQQMIGLPGTAPP